jgi:hypothetical protein
MASQSVAVVREVRRVRRRKVGDFIVVGFYFLDGVERC